MADETEPDQDETRTMDEEIRAISQILRLLKKLPDSGIRRRVMMYLSDRFIVPTEERAAT